MAALVEAEPEVELDERYEFDAPRHHDFDVASPVGAQPDQWFDTDGPKGGWRPLPGAGGGCLANLPAYQQAACSGAGGRKQAP